MPSIVPAERFNNATFAKQHEQISPTLADLMQAIYQGRYTGMDGTQVLANTVSPYPFSQSTLGALSGALVGGSAGIPFGLPGIIGGGLLGGVQGYNMLNAPAMRDKYYEYDVQQQPAVDYDPWSGLPLYQ